MRSIILFLFLSSGLLFAQSEELQSSEEQELKSGFRVSLFSTWGGPDLYYKGKKDEYHSLKAYKLCYSKRMPYKKDEPIVFYTKVEQPDEDPIYLPYLKSELPTEVIEPLIILYWNGEAKKGYSQVLEFSPTRFPFGSYQFVNLGATQIVGYVNDKKKRFQCAPYKSVISRNTIKNGQVTPIEMITKIQAKNLVLYSSVVKHFEKRRVIYFLYPQKSPTGRTVYKVDLIEDYSQGES